ncbi:MAG: hypothetical protein FJ098_03405 [Deltaproteobacteria bacterium]|nr:hypothetical protein [Deltaproteobacteria bacterium]
MITRTTAALLFLLLGACGSAKEPISIDQQGDVTSPQDQAGGEDVLPAADQGCLPQCGERECGDDGCGGSCGACGREAPFCKAGQCVETCDADCTDRECGDDGCGGSCGTCGPGEDCLDGLCTGDCTPDCGDRECGDDGCGGSCGACEPGWECNAGACLETCIPQCGEASCGGDGCGGSCGECPAGEGCFEGSCVPLPDPCEEACAGFECGVVDECACGTCGEDEVCDGHQCVPDCLPDCTTKECGPDGCGGTCGTCAPDEECWGYLCVSDCVPECGDKECGADNCGGVCGTCPGGSWCQGGTCVADCDPDCTGKQCGWDGCGGTCGSCPGGKWCSPDSWTCVTGACQLPTEFGDTQRVNALAVGNGGHPGTALDVDQDPLTCAPAGDCESGLDNQLWGFMSTLGSFTGVDPEDMLQGLVDSGDLNLLFEFRPQGGGGLHLGLFYGLEVNPACNPAGQVCDFLVASASYDSATCLPLILFDNALLAGAALTAGGPGYHFTLPVPMGFGEEPVNLIVERATLEASVTLAGGTVQSMAGVIGGAIPEQAFYDAVEAVPEDQLPLDKDLLLSFLGMLLNPDIDLDGNGDDDAVSVGLVFATGPANITEVVETYSPF